MKRAMVWSIVAALVALFTLSCGGGGGGGGGAAAPSTGGSAPAAPGIPTVLPGNTQLIVTWTAVSGATSYDVYYNTVNNILTATVFADPTPTDTTCTITGLANGTFYWVWVKAKNSYGTSSASPAATGTPASASKFAYTANLGNDTVSIYTINGTGALAADSSVATTQTGAICVAVDPKRKYLYVASQTSHTISQYSITSATGALTPIAAAVDVGAGTIPIAIAIDPSGKYLYTANYGNDTVSQYSINSGTGALTPIAAAVASGATFPRALTVDPAGKYLYVVNSNALAPPGSIRQFTIDSADGHLTDTTLSINAVTTPKSIAISPAGTYAYVANQVGGISQYTINAGTGAFTANGTTAAGTQPWSIAVDPSGKYVYVANYASHNVSQFAIQSDGTLSAVAAALLITGTAKPNCVAVDPFGLYVYVTNEDDDRTYAFTIGGGGVLSANGSATVAGTTTPSSVVVVAY